MTSRPSTSLDGCYCAVMGLPLWRLRAPARGRWHRSAADPSATLPRCASCPERPALHAAALFRVESRPILPRTGEGRRHGMAHIDRDGVKVYYEDHGSGPARPPQPRLQRHVADVGRPGRRPSPTATASSPGTCAATASPTAPPTSRSTPRLPLSTTWRRFSPRAASSSAVIGGLSLGGYMSLAFNVAHPGMTRALMLFDTGPGYRNPKGREAWNETAHARAAAFDEKGLDALGGSAEVRASTHTSAKGLAQRRPRHARPGRFARHGVPRAHQRPDARPRRRARPAVHRRAPTTWPRRSRRPRRSSSRTPATPRTSTSPRPSTPPSRSS